MQAIDLSQYIARNRTFDQLIIANRKNHDFERAAVLVTGRYLWKHARLCKDRRSVPICCIDSNLRIVTQADYPQIYPLNGNGVRPKDVKRPPILILRYTSHKLVRTKGIANSQHLGRRLNIAVGVERYISTFDDECESTGRITVSISNRLDRGRFRFSHAATPCSPYHIAIFQTCTNVDEPRMNLNSSGSTRQALHIER
jgi:hypothetical protein